MQTIPIDGGDDGGPCLPFRFWLMTIDKVSLRMEEGLDVDK